MYWPVDRNVTRGSQEPTGISPRSSGSGFAGPLVHVTSQNMTMAGPRTIQVLTARIHLNMDFFSINTIQDCKCIFSFLKFLNALFSVAYFIVRKWYIIRITHKICVNHLFMLPIRLPVNNRVLGEVKSYMQILDTRRSAFLTPMLFKGQLYCI